VDTPARNLNLLGSAWNARTPTFVNGVLRPKTRNVFVTWITDRVARSLVADGLRIELIVRLLDGYSSLPPGVAGRLGRARLGSRTLGLLDDYVRAHLDAQIRISDLAALAGMSRFHFARVFRASVGRTPHRYVLERRLDRARELVRSSGAPLRDIAAMTGFADQSHLTRTFKRTFGTTPAALRAG